MFASDKSSCRTSPIRGHVPITRTPLAADKSCENKHPRWCLNERVRAIYLFKIYVRSRHNRIHREVYVQRIGHRVVHTSADDVPQQLLTIREVRDAQEHDLHVHHQHEQQRVDGAIAPAGVQPIVAHTGHQPVHQRTSLPRERFGYYQILVRGFRRQLKTR